MQSVKVFQKGYFAHDDDDDDDKVIKLIFYETKYEYQYY
jgi:hypothetical protein